MSEIIIITYAYNAEKTIKQAIHSVLSQTFSDFKYYIIDNGSTDNTRAIIESFAKCDPRITVIINEKNSIWAFFEILPVVLKRHNDRCYLCVLDADDEYYPEFFGKMLSFIKENNLEVAACGNDFIDAQTNRLTGTRILSENLILENGGYQLHFPLYHQFMRTVWGKMFSFTILHNITFESWQNAVSYGGDTLFTMEAFRRAKRVGILAESLHQYYMSPKSGSHIYNPKRVSSDSFLHQTAIKYLLDHGEITKENSGFLYGVYFHAILDTLKVILGSSSEVKTKIDSISQIFTDQVTLDMLDANALPLEQTHELISIVSQWLISEKEILCEPLLSQTAKVFVTMRIYNELDSACVSANWNISERFELLTKVRENLPKHLNECNIDAQIVSLVKESDLLQLNEMNIDFFIFYREIVLLILRNQFESALILIEEIISEESEANSIEIEALLMLGTNLSAMLEFTEDFIYFKKLLISFLITSSRKEDAKSELADFAELLPDDKDFQQLKMAIYQ